MNTLPSCLCQSFLRPDGAVAALASAPLFLPHVNLEKAVCVDRLEQVREVSPPHAPPPDLQIFILSTMIEFSPSALPLCFSHPRDFQSTLTEEL